MIPTHLPWPHWRLILNTIEPVAFTWVNAEKPSETIVSAWVGQGLDSGEMGVGKALTYAEKFYLLKFFQIPTDKFDPDAFQGRQERSRGSCGR